MIKQSSKDELYMLVEDINKIMPSAKFSLHFAYDGVQLESCNGSRTLTGFLSGRELIEWIRAFRNGALYRGEFGVK